MSNQSGKQILIVTIVLAAKVRERLAVNKQRIHRFYMERFSLKNLNGEEVKSSIMFRSQIGLQLWKFWTLRWILIVLGKKLERISTFQPERVWVMMN
jgi:hypothetical protein